MHTDISKALGKTHKTPPLGFFFSVHRHKQDPQRPRWADRHRAGLSTGDAPSPCIRPRRIGNPKRVLLGAHVPEPGVIPHGAVEPSWKAELGEALDIRLAEGTRRAPWGCWGPGLGSLGARGLTPAHCCPWRDSSGPEQDCSEPKENKY